MLRTTKTENGAVRGTIGNDPRITVYKGIPYAAPPVGDLRWRAPRPAANWEGVREATEFAPMAVQGKHGVNMDDFYTMEVHPASIDYTSDEDCLYLNIWTPANTGSERLPVYFWIHGGGYHGGYSYEMLIDGERMARRGIVVVSIAYRLNVFGFLAHPDMAKQDPNDFHANFGLLDQLAALQWTRRNIAAFGGDPDRITIGGQSAGAGAVFAQCTSPVTNGLFVGAISQSGGGLRSIGYQQAMKPFDTAAAEGKSFLDSIGAKSLDEARAMPAMDVWNAYENQSAVRVQPVIDGKFLVEDPTDAIIHGRHAKIPYMLGYNMGEGQGRLVAAAAPNSPEDFLAQLKAQYGEIPPELAGIQTMDDVNRALESSAFNSRAVASALFWDVQAEQDGTSYAYCFDHDMPGDDMGPYHGAELWFMFESLARCWRPFTGKHYDLARQVCNYWVNFVKSGDPNGPDADGSPMPTWASYDKTQKKLMLFADAPQCVDATPDKLLSWALDHHMADIRRAQAQE
ncbi:carboxylesterase family protein [Ruminococcaceae bacterium OttesenSCG-928-L11]|nr:carboxylesterase family protein [Ruminococcaceae bacterium OttesenSCG-928-L11]